MDFDDKITEAILSFVGTYSQIPPMYSALKVNGKKLYEFADIVLDNMGCVGDASVYFPEINRNAAPTSTSAGAAMLNAIVTGCIEKMLEDGYVPEVFSSSNGDGGDAVNEAFLQKYRGKIKSL